MGTPSDQTALWNAAAGAKALTHPLDLNPFAREFKRVLRPGDLLLISDYPLQSDQRNLDRHQSFAAELGTYGAFRLWATNAA